MSKHTPGEWEAEHNSVCTEELEICTMSAVDRKGSDWFHGLETFSNARLISAAPDLLVALRELLDHVNAHCVTVGDCLQASNAIAKAEGDD
jgi:hypothetical protein